MNANLICEAGVHYCFPRRDTDTPPEGCIECRYRRWRDGQNFGVERVFIEFHRPNALYILLQTWTNKGHNQPGPKYTYTAEE